MTSNALKAKELKENIRHNKEDEKLRDEDIKFKKKKETHEEFHRGMKDFFTGLQGSANAVNDFKWYSKFETTLRNALKQPVTDTVGGSKYTDNSGEFEALATRPFNLRMSKIALVNYKFIPTIGNSDNADSGIAIATREFNTRVRASNAGATNYDAADLMMYPLASDSIIYILAWLRKCLSLIQLADAADPILNLDVLLASMFDGNATSAKYFRLNYPSFVSIYNEVVDKLNKSRMPAEMPFILRHAFLTGTLFMWEEGVCTSFYNVLPDYYFIYDEANATLSAQTFFTRLNSGLAIDDNLRTIFMSMINPLLNSQSINTMAGDLEKANVKFVHFDNINVDDVRKLKLVINSDVKYLQSFKNADIVGPINAAEISIKQGIDPDSNPFLYQGTYSGTTWHGMKMADKYVYYVDTSDTDEIDDSVALTKYFGDRYVDYYDSKKVTDEDQLYNLSFKVASNVPNEITYCRSEIINQMQIMELYVDSTNVSQHIFNSNIADNSPWTDNLMQNVTAYSDIDGNILTTFKDIQLLYDIDFLPCIYCLVPNTTDNCNEVFPIWKRNHNRNKVTKPVIAKIHKYCLQSLFLIP